MIKKVNIFLYALTLLTGLASCEMKDEIIGKGDITGETGLLELGVEKSKAGGSMSTKATDNVDEFPVTITGKDVEYTKTFDSYAALQEENPITLPVGTYTVAAHSPGELTDQMTSPYYGGESEVLIKSKETNSSKVICKMQNMKIALTFSATMDQTYTAWELTVSDGKTHTISYTKKDGLTPAAVYWKMDDNTSDIFIRGYVTNKEGKNIPIIETATKSQTDGYTEEDGVYYKGGDFLNVKLDPVKDPSGETTPGVEKESIKIIITGFNAETEDKINVDVDNEPTTPTDPTDPTDPDPTPTPTGLSITLPEDITYTIGNAPAKADAVITASKGLKKVTVKIVAGNEAFAGILAQLTLGEATFVEGVDLVSHGADLETLFTSIGKNVAAPKEGDTEYTFPIGEFFSFLDITEATDPGKAHQFIISVEDKEGNKTEDTLNVIINAAE